MNDRELAKIEKSLKKTHYAFKKNRKIDGITRNLTSFMKGLSPEQAALLLVKVLVHTAPVLTRKKIHLLLKDSIEPNMGLDIELLLEELCLVEEKPLKLRDLLKEN